MTDSDGRFTRITASLLVTVVSIVTIHRACIIRMVTVLITELATIITAGMPMAVMGVARIGDIGAATADGAAVGISHFGSIIVVQRESHGASALFCCGWVWERRGGRNVSFESEFVGVTG